MQPNNYQSLPPPLPDNYLDTIAAKPAAKTMNPLLLWGLIGGVLLLLVVSFSLISSLGHSSPDTLTTFAAQLSKLKTLSQNAQGNIKNSELRTLNSSLTLVLTNANHDLAEPLKLQKIDLNKKDNKAVTAVAAEVSDLKDRLEDARLNAVYDRTYAREITFYLKTLHSEMSQLYTSTSSKSLKSALKATNNNLSPIEQQFSAFNAD
jgi:hypothetical protein